MSRLIVYEDDACRNFLPLVYWRPLQHLRLGRRLLIDHIRERLQESDPGLWVRPEMHKLTRARQARPVNRKAQIGTLLVNTRWIPEGQPEISPCPCVGVIGDDEVYVHCDEQLANRLDAAVMLDHAQRAERLGGIPRVPAKGWVLQFPWDLIHFNGDMLLMEWHRSDARIAGERHPGAELINEKYIHLGTGSTIRAQAVLDAEEGPIYIGERATIMPHAVIQGPSFIGDDCIINPGAWIRSQVAIGPACRIGGEVTASIWQAYSNKQHHGFIGHSYIAEWVNIGAGTTTSNLKNTYGRVKVPLGGVPVDTGETFMGAIIGDFARLGINQSLTTGTVIGFGSSLASGSIKPPFIPSLRFITDSRDEPYDIERCLAVAKKMMSRRAVELSAAEQDHFLSLPVGCREAETV